MSQFHLSVLAPDTGQIINHSESNFSSLLKNYSSLERFIYPHISFDLNWEIYYRRIYPLPLVLGHYLHKTWQRLPIECEVYLQPSLCPPSAQPL